MANHSTTDHAAQASFHAGLNGPGRPHEGPDVDDPREAPHPSHAWVLVGRWTECAHCAVRDYYAGAAVLCQARPRAGERREDPPPAWALDSAIFALAADLDAFGAWWRARAESLGLARPSLDEWAAEFLEWRTGRRA